MNIRSAWAELWNRDKASPAPVVKASDSTSLVEFFSLFNPEPSGKSIETYARVATIYRAARRIALDLASAPLLIERKQGKEWKPLDEDSKEFGGVAGVFKKCNPWEGRTALWTRFHLSSSLAGRAVLLTDYVNGGKPSRSNPPKQLRVLRADAVKPIFNDQGVPVAYRYTPDGGQAMELRPDEVLFHRSPSPASEWDSTSWAETVRLYAAIEDELSKYQRNFFKNGARGSVVLSTDRTMTDDQARQTRAAWSSNNAGTSNAHSLWLATNGLKVTELTGRRDTDFVDLFRIIKEQISTASGVPPAFLGDYSSATYANVVEQTPIYLEGVLFPEGNLLEENLTEIVLPRFDTTGSLRARLDWSKVPMVQRSRLLTARSYYDMSGGPLFTREEARVALGLPEVPEVGEFAEPIAPILPGMVPQRSQRPRPASSAPRKVAKFIDTPERNAVRVKVAKDLDEKEAPNVRDIRRYFRALEARVLAKLNEGEKAHGKAFADDLVDEVREVEVLESVIARIYLRVIRERGPEAMTEVGALASDFFLEDPAVQDFIRENAYRNGVRVVGTVAEKVKDVLREQSASGETISELADRLKDLFDGERAHALTVARTETVRAYNAASVEAWKQTGEVEEMEWMTAQDDAVRESHREIDGETAKIGDSFSIGLKFPGDPAGEAGETINCRCTLAPVLRSLDETRIAPDLFAKLFTEKGLTDEDAGTHPLAPSLNGTGAR